MKTKKNLFQYTILLLLFIACSKNSSSSGNDSTNTKKFPGTLYYHFAGDVGYTDFSTGKTSDRLLSINNSLYDSYDVSWDNKKVMISLDLGGPYDFDQKRFILRDKNKKLDYSSIKDKDNSFDVVYDWDDIGVTDAHISPNEKYIALDAQEFADLPITIIDATNGKYFKSWKVQGVNFSDYGIPVWTRDNTLYFRIGNSVYKCSPNNNYSSAPKVFSMEGMTHLTVNPDGTKCAFRKNKHLWMCNMDGSNVQQITTSEITEGIKYEGEKIPTFSPDGKYIAFTGNTKRGAPWSGNNASGEWVGTVGAQYGYVAIIPADGKLYDLDDKKSGTTWLKEPGSDYGLPCSSRLVWR